MIISGGGHSTIAWVHNAGVIAEQNGEICRLTIQSISDRLRPAAAEEFF
jgi:hypothetical protein